MTQSIARPLGDSCASCQLANHVCWTIFFQCHEWPLRTTINASEDIT